MTRPDPDAPERLRFRAVTGRLTQRTAMGFRLAAAAAFGGREEWAPLACLSLASRRAVEAAPLGETLTLDVETWAADERRWRRVPDAPTLL